MRPFLQRRNSVRIDDVHSTRRLLLLLERSRFYFPECSGGDPWNPSPSQILGTTSRNLRDPSPSQILLSTFSTFYFLWSKFQTFCNGVTPGTLGVDIIESQDWGPLGGLSREYEPPSPVYRCASRSARSRHCTAPSYLTLPRHPGAGTVSGKAQRTARRPTAVPAPLREDTHHLSP